MATTYEIPVHCWVKVTVEDDVEYAIDRFVDLEPGNEFSWSPYLSRQQVLEYLAVSCVAYGRGDASRLDGFADLDQGKITMHDYDYTEADY